MVFGDLEEKVAKYKVHRAHQGSPWMLPISNTNSTNRLVLLNSVSPYQRVRMMMTTTMMMMKTMKTTMMKTMKMRRTMLRKKKTLKRPSDTVSIATMCDIYPLQKYYSRCLARLHLAEKLDLEKKAQEGIASSRYCDPTKHIQPPFFGKSSSFYLSSGHYFFYFTSHPWLTFLFVGYAPYLFKFGENVSQRLGFR